MNALICELPVAVMLSWLQSPSSPTCKPQEPFPSLLALPLLTTFISGLFVAGFFSDLTSYFLVFPSFS